MKTLRIFSLLTILIFLSNCIEEPPNSSQDNISGNFADHLFTHISEMRVIQKSKGIAPYIDSETLNNNLQRHLLIDIRTPNDYSDGHIPGAINLSQENIISYLESIFISRYDNIIIISNTGQRAAYVTCLLSLYGYDNVLCLKLGMVYWNTKFHHYLTDHIQTISDSDPGCMLNSKPNLFEEEFFELPTLARNSEAIDQFLKNRVIEILGSETILSNDLFSPETVLFNYEEVFKFRAPDSVSYNGFTLACYGSTNLYSLYSSKEKDKNLPSHPHASKHLNEPIQFDYRLDGYIQLLDPNKPILLYSADGQSSAYLTALLRVLGYDAKWMIYGVHHFQYMGLVTSDVSEVSDQAFDPNLVNDFPYEEGNN